MLGRRPVRVDNADSCVRLERGDKIVEQAVGLGDLVIHVHQDRNVEAEAALRAATRVDPTFADAWYNLSDLLDEQGRVQAAIESLRTALRVAPDHADAMFNIALLLQRTNQYAEAADYWRRYLAIFAPPSVASRTRPEAMVTCKAL